MMNLPWDHGDWSTQPAPTPELAQQLASFDMARARDLLAPLCTSGAQARSAEVLNVWYTPPSRLLLVIELTLDDGGKEHFTVRVDAPAASGSGRAGSLAAAGEAAAAAATNVCATATAPGAAAVAEAEVGSTNGCGAGVDLPAWPARAWRLPADPGGLALERLLDPHYSAGMLEQAAVEPPVAPRWPTSTGRPARSPASPTRLLSYLPGQRLALRLGDDEAAARGRAVVLKCQPGATTTHAAMLGLWRSPLRGFAMAEPLAADAAMSTRWERFVPGRRMEAVAREQGWAASMQGLMPALVALHHSPVPGLALQRRADVLARLQGKVHKRVAAALPRHLPALTRQIRELADWTVPEAHPTATLHGDLHTGNLLFTAGGEVVFIDLDSLVQGDPAYDLALLGTRLLLLALMGRADPAQMVELSVRLPHEYVAAGGDAGLPARYPWHVATLLLSRQLKTCIRHCAPQMHTLAGHLLDASASVLRAGAVTHGLLDSCLEAA